MKENVSLDAFMMHLRSRKEPTSEFQADGIPGPNRSLAAMRGLRRPIRCPWFDNFDAKLGDANFFGEFRQSSTKMRGAVVRR